jgi:predicted nuclease of predicted toxin-antitoxin system
VRFLIDNQLPRALARFLKEKGHEAVHVLDLDLGHLTPDSKIWEYAAAHAYIMVTKDSDFVDLALLDSRPVQVVLVCLGNCRNMVLLAAFEKVLDSLGQQLESGETLIEIWE